jgi:hypothetical protein
VLVRCVWHTRYRGVTVLTLRTQHFASFGHLRTCPKHVNINFHSQTDEAENSGDYAYSSNKRAFVDNDLIPRCGDVIPPTSATVFNENQKRDSRMLSLKLSQSLVH